MKEIISQCQLSLLPLADPVRALAMRAYMKNRFEFLGIPAPDRRKACADIIRQLKTADADELLQIANGLWTCEQREYQYLAVDILARHYRRLRLEDVPALLTLVQQKSWWDTVDGLAGVVGDVLQQNLTASRDIQAGMDKALGHPDFWVRRIALLHQLGWREQTDVNRLFSYALALADEKEFFIRKAIGWALRDYAWHDPVVVRNFLQENQGRLSGLSYREAAKNLEKLGK